MHTEMNIYAYTNSIVKLDFEIIMQMNVHGYTRDSAVFMYKDLLNAPIPAGDMAATYRETEKVGRYHMQWLIH